MLSRVHRCCRIPDRRVLRLPRGALKTASYALMHLGVAMTVAFALTRNWHAALAIGLIEPLVQTVAYSMHERAWARRPVPAA
ncbi:MAG: hypothetical protein CMH93_11300 [Oceanicaulis sp.]|uniref:DUF2061 domain-containing protein n=1 Tax=Maricaulis virginensis TaxID=144022 RepID=A0A9W6IJJ2_9PROT|nr:DUF2061 domain-containing protein [Maricaulis virginensis]MAC40087.1 hypothetical protein [Oceanicaulis sp.]GLK50659.1 hypothetical protein GCM10017621_01670 [Maricaulis virginensis]|tara:strand:+ start:268 stop:513 length:246 start_codon:yes stop_codon:yes gene_type:complete